MDMFSLASECLRSLAYVLGIISFIISYVYDSKKKKCTEETTAVVGKDGLERGFPALCGFLFGTASFGYKAGGKDIVVHGCARSKKLRLETGQDVQLFYNPKKATDYYIPSVSPVPAKRVLMRLTGFLIWVAVVVVPIFAPNGFAAVQDSVTIVSRSLFASFVIIAFIVSEKAPHQWKRRLQAYRGSKDIAAVMANMAVGGMTSAAYIIASVGLVTGSDGYLHTGIAGLIILLVVVRVFLPMINDKLYERMKSIGKHPFADICSYIYIFTVCFTLFGLL